MEVGIAASSAWAIVGGALPLLWSATKTLGSGSMSSSSSETAAKNRNGLAFAALLSGVYIIGFLVILAFFMEMFHRTRRYQRRKYGSDEETRRAGRIHEKLANLSPQYVAMLNSASYYTKERDLYDYSKDAQTDQNRNTIILAVAGLVAIAIQRGTEYVSTVATSAVSLAPAYGTFGAIAVLGQVFILYSDTILSVYRQVWSCGIRPFFIDKIALPAIDLGVVIPSIIAYPFIIFIFKAQSIARTTPIRIILAFAFSSFPVYAGFIGKAISAFVLGLVQWLTSNPSLNNFPALRFFREVIKFVVSFYENAARKACGIVDWVIGGIIRGTGDDSAAQALHYAVNVPIFTVQTLAIQPLLYGRTPQFQGFNDLYTNTFLNVGYWIQNITVASGDTFIGDLAQFVNGTSTLAPGDDFIYVVRAFQAKIFVAASFYISAALSILWEVGNIAVNVASWFRLRGYRFWELSMFYNNVMSGLDATESIIDIAPQCEVPGSGLFESDKNIRFGQLISVFKWIFVLIFIIKDVVIGEVYTVFEGRWPGYFTAGYMYANGNQIQNFQSHVERADLAIGCAVALLDPGIGTVINGALNVIISYLLFVVVSMFAFVRYAYEENDPNILDRLDVGENSPINLFTREALKLSQFATFIYRFENADSVTCGERLSFLCALGRILESAITVVVLVVDLLLRTTKNLVKALVSLTSRGELGTVVPLNIQPLVDEGYSLGCKGGVIFATIIPIPLACHTSRPNFCAVKEYNPVPSPQTPNICLATFMCRVGNYVGVVLEVGALLLQFGANLSFTGDALIFVLKQFAFIARNKVASPICPFGHFLDCPISIVLGKSDTCSRFFCLINAGIIRFLDVFGNTLIEVVRLIIYVVELVFGGNANAGLIIKIIEIGFGILRTGIEQFFYALLGSLFGWIIDIIDKLCPLICIGGSAPCENCRRIVREAKGLIGNFADPDDNSNYLLNKKKRRSTAHTESGTPQDDDYLNFENNKPLLRAFGFLYTVQEYNTTSGQFEEREHRRYTTLETMPTHMATYVTWTSGTPCSLLFRAVNNTHLSDLGIAEQLRINDCIFEKAAAVRIAQSSSFFSWVPEDIIYNRMRIVGVVGIAIRVAAMMFQYVADRSSPAELVMSESYRRRWEMFSLNVTHYSNEFAQHYYGPNATLAEMNVFDYHRKNLTLSWYYARNFEDPRANHQTGEFNFSNSSGTGAYTYNEAMNRAYLSSSDFLFNAMGLQQNYTQEMLHTHLYQAIATGKDPVTNMSISDGSMQSFTNVYTGENETNVRAVIFQDYGDEYVTTYDEAVVSAGLFSSIATFVSEVFGFMGDIGVAFTPGAELDFHDQLANANYLGNESVQQVTWNQQEGGNKKRDAQESTNSTPTLEELKAKQKRRLEQERDAKGISLSWSDLVGIIKKAYAERIDTFMKDNGGDYPLIMNGKGKRRSISEFNEEVEMRRENLKKRGVISRVLIATVAAASSAASLNTTYIPLWCNSTSKMRELCATADWKHASQYLVDDPVTRDSFIAVLNKTTEFFATATAPRSERARKARTFVASIGGGFMTRLSDTTTRLYAAMDSEQVPQKIEAVKARWEETAAAATAAAAAAEKRQNSAEGDDIPPPIVYDPLDQPPLPYVYKTSEEQIKEVDEWMERTMGWANAPTYTLDGKINSTSWFDSIIGSEMIEDYAYWVEETTLTSPSLMRIARPRNAELRKKASSADSTVAGSVMRAWLKFAKEERLIATEKEHYTTLFSDSPEEVYDPKTELSAAKNSRKLAWGVQEIEIKSVTLRKSLIKEYARVRPLSARSLKPVLDVIDRENPADTYDSGSDYLLPKVKIRAYNKVLLKKERVGDIGINFASGYNTTRPEYRYSVYETNKMSTKRTRDQMSAQISTMVAESAGMINLHENVIEISIGNTGAASPANQDGFHSHFFIPYDDGDEEDVARRILECKLGDQFLCSDEGCILVDNWVGYTIDQILIAVGYITGYLPPAFLSSTEFLAYTYSNTATARIGHGEFPARYPARGISNWYYLRGLPREVQGAQTGDDGPKWRWFFEDIVGSPLPASLVENGTLYQDYLQYMSANPPVVEDPNFGAPNPTTSGDNDGFYYEAVYFVQETLGFPLLQIMDTAVFYLNLNYSPVSSWAIKKLRCDLDYSNKIYSLAGASYLYTTLVIGAAAVVYPVGGLLVSGSIIASGYMISPIAILFLAYGWSPVCFPLVPGDFVKDTFDYLAYSVVPKCGIIEGLLVLNEDYDTNTCQTCSEGLGALFYNTTTPLQIRYANCYDWGFRNVYDSIEATYLSYDTIGASRPLYIRALRGIFDTTYNVMNSLVGDVFAKPSVSKPWRSPPVVENYVSSDAAYSIVQVCSVVGLVTSTGKLGLASVAAYNLLLPVLTGAGSVVAYVLTVIPSLLVYFQMSRRTFKKKVFETSVHNNALSQLDPLRMQDTIFEPLLDDEDFPPELLVDAENYGGGGDDDDNDGDDGDNPNSNLVARQSFFTHDDQMRTIRRRTKVPRKTTTSDIFERLEHPVGNAFNAIDIAMRRIAQKPHPF